eukprot:gene13412-13539_t
MNEPPSADDTLVTAALKVLLQPSPWKKADFTQRAVELWRSGAISRVSNGPQELSRVPDRPHRADDQVTLVAPRDMPKLGKGGTLASRQALLHSLVHIENWAVDLSWDIIARFGSDPRYQLPKAFFDDFVQVAADECSHFSMLCRRLEELGSHYGALPAHDGLWESASQTAHSLPARLAVEHCVHEARGLDVLPSTVNKFRSNGDEQTAALLEDVIYAEEISHCAAGVRKHFKGNLKPPFNDAARAKAGFESTTQWQLLVQSSYQSHNDFEDDRVIF